MNAPVSRTSFQTADACSDLDLLLGLWRRVLQTDQVTPDCNFFDLGGDSLLALSLFLEIERATGRHLPITAIYDAQTVTEQAALLREEDALEFSPLVLLKEGNGEAPLFIFHGIGGTVVEFARLGKLIEIAGPVYAVQAQGVDGNLPPLESVEEMAELYVEAIRAVQPHGPYRLCGYSFGGVIAVEVARRLKSMGAKIDLLFMIDAYAHPITWPALSRFKVRSRRAVSRAFSRLRSSPAEAVKSVARVVTTRVTRLRSETPAERLARKRVWLKQTQADLPAALLQTRCASDKALIHYRPSYYPGRAIFLKAKHPDPDFPRDPKRVYRGLFHELDVQVAPGSHMTIITEHAESVAARINAALRNTKLQHIDGALSAPLMPVAEPC